MLLGLLREGAGIAGKIFKRNKLAYEEIREETRLQSPANEAAARPKEAFPKLADFLGRLEDRRAAYHVSAFHQEATSTNG